MRNSLVSVLLSVLILVAIGVGILQLNIGSKLTDVVHSCEIDLSKCQADLKTCVSKPTPKPPPGPIIVLDPTKTDHVWIINSIPITDSPPYCVTMDAGYTNENHIGVGIEEFSAKLSGITQPVGIKKFKATFHDASGNHDLLVMRTSLDTLVWKLDGAYLLPEPRNSDQEFPTQWCGSIVSGSIKVVRTTSSTDNWLDPEKVTIQPTVP